MTCHIGDRISSWLSDFTGISSPYEAPQSPELHIRTDEQDVSQAVRIIAEYLTEHGYL